MLGGKVNAWPNPVNKGIYIIVKKLYLIFVALLIVSCEGEDAPKPNECSADSDCEFGELCYDAQCEVKERYNCLDGGEKSPKLEISPTSIDFGEASTATKAVSITIKNTGTCTLNIADATIDSFDQNRFDCDICNASALPVSVYPDRTNRFQVRMYPGAPGDYSGGLVLRTNDSESPTIRLPLLGSSTGKPSITVIPAEIDFGFMRAGGSVEKQVFIINEGSGSTALTVEKVELVQDSEQPFSLSAGLIFPAKINPVRMDAQAGVVVKVNYSPNQPADHRAELLIYYDGGQTKRVRLKGSELAPNINATPLSIDFGTIQLGQAGYERITFQNYLGKNPLLATARLADGTSQDLRLPEAFPSSIPPGGVFELKVIYEPTIAGPLNDTIIIESNDPDEPVLNIPVSGSGEAIGEEIISVDMIYVADSSSVLDIDLRDVDLILENPVGQVCREAMPVTRWGTRGNCTWSGTPPKENPERFVLSQVTEDGTYLIKLNYIEDCATLPTALAASLLGLGTEALVEELSDGQATAGREDVANVIEEVCAERRSTTASLTIRKNGQIIAEQSFRVEAKGALVDAFTLTRNNGQFSISQ